jgi:hypothetical protein
VANLRKNVSTKYKTGKFCSILTQKGGKALFMS